jgi:hypothetical protein
VAESSTNCDGREIVDVALGCCVEIEAGPPFRGTAMGSSILNIRLLALSWTSRRPSSSVARAADAAPGLWLGGHFVQKGGTKANWGLARTPGSRSTSVVPICPTGQAACSPTLESLLRCGLPPVQSGALRVRYGEPSARRVRGALGERKRVRPQCAMGSWTRSSIR